MRFEGRLPLSETAPIIRPEERLVPILQVPTDVILDFDALHFPISRPTFLESWLHQPEHQGLAIMRSHEICAYGIVRPCASGYKIGPLFADNPNQARNLVLALCQDLKDEAPIYLDLPAANAAAVDLATELGMTMVFETARMYKGLTPKLPIQRIFGITTFELG